MKKLLKELVKKLVYVLLIVLLVVLNYEGIIGFKDKFTKYKKCGVVTNGLEKNRTYKSNTYRDLYLGVKWDDGSIEALDVSPTTYIANQVGDRVCFEFTKSPKREGWAIFGITIIFIEFIVLFSAILSWAFDWKLFEF